MTHLNSHLSQVPLSLPHTHTNIQRDALVYTLLTLYKYNKPLETVVMTASAVLGGQSGVRLDSRVW